MSRLESILEATQPDFKVHRTASVADTLLFDALPEQTKALVERIYGDVPPAAGKWMTADELEELYEEAFEAGQESVEVEKECPSLTRRELEQAVKNIITGRKG